MTPLAPTIAPSLSAELAHRVEAFEAVLEAHPDADLAAHLPPSGHPLYLAVLGELIRIDLERAWSRDRRKRIADYTARFPAVLTNANLLSAVAFEEYRQRAPRRRGRAARRVPAHVRRRYERLGRLRRRAGRSSKAPRRMCSRRRRRSNSTSRPRPFRSCDRRRTGSRRRSRPRCSGHARAKAISDAEALAHWQEATESLPEVGTEFVGFHLVAELGRGAFGRVYLARAGRPRRPARRAEGRVPASRPNRTRSRSCSTRTSFPSTRTTRAGPFQAVCMPYLGGTTLAQVVKSLSSMPGVPSSGKELRSTLHAAGSSTPRSEPAERLPAPVPRPSVRNRPPRSPNPSRTWFRSPTERPTGGRGSTGCRSSRRCSPLAGQLADGLSHAPPARHPAPRPQARERAAHRRRRGRCCSTSTSRKTRSCAGRPSGPDRRHAAVHGPGTHARVPRPRPARSTRGATVFSLGVILFELLTGRHPFPVRKRATRAETVAPDDRRPRAAPPSVREVNPAVSPGVEAIVLKCLAPDPAERYQTAPTNCARTSTGT